MENENLEPYITFDNGSQPALNDTNVNNMQKLIKQDIITKHDTLNNKINGTVLYENETGTTSNITLSESAVNFDYIEIYYKDLNGRISSRKVENITGSIILDIPVVGSTQLYISGAGVSISGTSLTFEWNRRAISWNTHDNTDSAIYITKVVGYKIQEA